MSQLSTTIQLQEEHARELRQLQDSVSMTLNKHRDQRRQVIQDNANLRATVQYVCFRFGKLSAAVVVLVTLVTFFYGVARGMMFECMYVCMDEWMVYLPENFLHGCCNSLGRISLKISRW